VIRQASVKGQSNIAREPTVVLDGRATGEELDGTTRVIALDFELEQAPTGARITDANEPGPSTRQGGVSSDPHRVKPEHTIASDVCRGPQQRRFHLLIQRDIGRIEDDDVKCVFAKGREPGIGKDVRPHGGINIHSDTPSCAATEGMQHRLSGRFCPE